MHTRTAICLIFLLLWLGTSFLLSQHKGFSTYSVSQGLPQSKITSVLQDKRGLLWIGTQSAGLAQFDGERFQLLGTQQGLIDNRITCLREDHLGNIWVGTQSGISIYNGISFNSLNVGDQQKHIISSIWQDPQQHMWIGTDRGAYIYRDETWQKVDAGNRFRIRKVNCFESATDSSIWMGFDKGLIRIEGQELELLSRSPITDIVRDAQGRMWTASILGGVQLYEGAHFVPQFTDSEIREGFIQDLQFDSKGNLWIGGKLEGVAHYDFTQRKMNIYKEGKGISNNNIQEIIEDSWGNIWIATLGGGLNKFHDQQFLHYGKAQGLPDPYVLCFEKDALGNMWIGMKNKGIAVLEGRNLHPHEENHLFHQVSVSALYLDSQKRMWIGTQGRGLALFQDTAFQFFPSPAEIGANFIVDIVEGPEGKIWIASKYRGIFLLDPQSDSLGVHLRAKAITKASGLLSNNISCLHLDKQNRLWYGTRDNGAGFVEKDSLPGNLEEAILPRQHIKTLTEDSKDYLWIGTEKSGVHHLYLKGETYETVSHQEELNVKEVNFLASDANNHLWLGSPSGLYQLSLNFERKFEEIHFFGRDKGLIDIETNPNAYYLEKNSQIWIGAISGFSIYQAAKTIDPSISPRVHLDQIKLFYEPLHAYPAYQSSLGAWGKIKRPLRFSPFDNHLIFEFGGVDLGNMGTLTYSYRMKGLGNKWSPPNPKSEASYHLSPGRYNFMVKAINAAGVESEVLDIPIEIQIPLYKRTEFILASIALLALLLWLLFRLRLNQVRKIARIDQEKLQIEKNLIQLEQKALRLQMNPHFLFNALNSIQGLITDADTQKARYYLAKFSKLMRLVLENSRESMIPLEDEIETLEHYLTVEQFSSGEKFTFHIQCDGEIDTELVLIPPMMIQPFIENAIIHGVAHLDRPGEIEVDFRKIGQRIECSISDNGVGREKAAQLKSQQDHKHKSTALIVTQERLDILSQGANWGKSIEIIDLKDGEGKSMGTKVIVRLPLILDH